MSLKTPSQSEQSHLVAFDRRSEPSSAVCRTLSGIFTTYLLPKGGLTVVGSKNLPRKGSYIVSPGHTSQLDTAVVGKAVLDSTGSNLHFMAKPEYWQGRFGWASGRFVELGGGFPIERGSPFDQQPDIRERIDQIFADQDPLCIYPQGKRIEKGQPITKLRAGIGYLAVKYGLPVIPVGIAGTLERDHMTVVFGEPTRAEHVNFDLGDPSAIKEVAGLAGEFRRDLTLRMEDLRLQAETVRSWAMAA